MPQVIDKIKVNRVMKSRLQGKSKKQSMLEAGYSINSASQAKRFNVVNEADKMIENSIRKREDITVTKVLDNLAKEANEAIKASDRIQANIWLGKYLKMFTDVSETTNKTPDKIQIIYVNRQPVENKEVTEPDKLT